MVGYGGDPAAVLDTVMALAGQGAPWVWGTHEAAALDPPLDSPLLGDQSAQWTNAQLAPRHSGFLADLPLARRLGASALLVHASADDPGQWH